jgi:SpoVK/Ycf46/Vps4 family AAA+-type ATPase
MATAEQLKALMRSFAEGDTTRFLSIAMQVAAQEARAGHSKLAQELRALIDQAKERGVIAAQQPQRPLLLAQPKGELAGLLSLNYPKTRLADMVLEESTRARLERVLHEQRQGELLRSHALRPRHRLLLVGPPGSGKTMTAAALSGEMSLPLFSIQLDGLLTRFMGETASKLRLVFDAMRTTRGVYLFDEFDAIGGHRTATNDVGEIRRVLNSFLQFIEQDESNGLIIAATNHAELLDEALFRRFDDVLEYKAPPKDLVARAIENRLGQYMPTDRALGELAESAEGLSFAEIVRACDDALKEAVMSEQRSVGGETLLRAFAERKGRRRKT